ncbi:leader peptidase (signal peptidase I) [Candidatus Campylobacter infans]|uniref:Signal peptidase I n=1 Tax=Candidatus Campylobacter infans TaxID=2561898 RepID=A0A7H9CH57_9BACT|nr:signal peptidase I [Candidatus Campylobacter infans]QLI05001.1 leader peptidase (signal peptidase I) [Candidatus Campylobacter infans]
MKDKIIKAFSAFNKFSASWTGTIIIVLFFIFFVAQAFVIPSGSMKNSLLIGDFLFVKKFSYGMSIPRIPWLEIPVAFDFDKDGHLWQGERPKRGDIVVFRYPLEPKIYYVKRMFAKSGDEVIFSPNTMYLRASEGDEYMKKNYDQNDLVRLNGKLFIKEPYKNAGIHYDLNERKDNFGGQKLDIFTIAMLAKSKGQFAMDPIYVDELPALQIIDDASFNAFYFKVKDDEFFMVGDNRENSNDSRFWGAVEYKYIVGKPWFVYFSWDKDYKVRWERVGRFVDSLENDPKYAKSARD